MSITVTEAMARTLSKNARAVTTEYELFLLTRQLYRAKVHDGERLRVRKAKPDLADGHRLINDLNGGIIQNPRLLQPVVAQRALQLDRDFKSGVYRVLAAPDQPADEVCCEVDPFCYISHLSAMQYHGLTTRTPVELTLTTPFRALWKKLRDARMVNDYGDDLHEADAVMALQQYNFGAKVRGRVVLQHESRHPGEWRQIRDKATRVATIGQTFVDMLGRASWCGSIHHVLEVWENEARTFLEEIVAAVDRAPTTIIKVRAGYLLEEKLGIRDERIAQWARYAQRGGSRVLDPEAPYEPVFSEKWMISLNV